MFIQEESDHYDLYSEEERQQFLFQVFKHIALGGPVNQVYMYASHDCECQAYSEC